MEHESVSARSLLPSLGITSTVALLLALWLSFYLVQSYYSWRRNLARAKKSGLRVDSGPIFLGQAIWQAAEIFMMPILERLPHRWTAQWLDITHGSWAYMYGFEAYERRGTDMIMLASPGGIYLSLANAEAISKLCERRADFPKPTEVYKIVDIFGTSLISNEGQVWRRHRKATAPAFSERNNGLVWAESIRQALGVLDVWAGRTGSSKENMHMPNIYPDLADLSLHVISRAGFGVPMSWTVESDQTSEQRESHYSASLADDGSEALEFKRSLKTVLQQLIWFAIFSPRTMGWIPFQTTRKIAAAWRETDRYWQKLLNHKLSQLRNGETDIETMDLMLRLVEESGINGPHEPTITPQEVTGNAFVFTVAGHETTALSLQNCLIYLATNLPAQKRLQNDIDAIIGPNTPPAQWDYRTHCDALYNSMVGAVINEQLRLHPPLIVIPKCVRGEPQPVTVDGREIVVPAGTFIHLNAFAVHRNTRYWPHSPSKRTGKAHDLEDFVPERWLEYGVVDSTAGGEQEGEASAAPRSQTLFVPPRGAFIPFSDGQRGCIGRRFALAELTAVLTVVFSRYSVELATEEWASEEEVEGMLGAERRALYRKAVDGAYCKLETGCEALITLQLAKGSEIALRLRKRGQERFFAV